MNSAPELPFAGITVENVYAIKQTYELAAVDSDEGEEDKRQISFLWDWRIVEVPTLEVRLGIKVDPSGSAAEQIMYEVVGRFRVEEGRRPVPLEAFVKRNAVATLLPFAREGLVALSSRGPYEAYYLPQLSAVQLAEQLDFDQSTGFRQIREDSKLKAFFDGDHEDRAVPL